MTTGRNSAIAVSLGVRDWLVEWRISLCLSLGVAAAAVPLLVLFSIRAGIVEGMREQLARDPSSRELHTVGQTPISQQLVAQLARRSDVGFVAPTVRILAASGVLRADASGAAQVADLLPTGRGDPLVVFAGGVRQSYRTLIVSQLLARTLKLKAGQAATLIVDRVRTDGAHEAAKLRLPVTTVLPAWAADQRVALIDQRLLAGIERYREDPAAQTFARALDMEKTGRRQRSYAGLRLYARTIDDVAGLRDWLLQHGLVTEGHLSEIRLIQRTSSALMMVFLLIASVVGAGLCLSLAAAQWAWVERRRRDLGYLRLIGFESFQLGLLPAVQSLLSVSAGIAVGVMLALINSILLNHVLAGQLGDFGSVSHLAPAHVMAAVVLALAAGLIASLLAAFSAASVTPASVLRQP